MGRFGLIMASWFAMRLWRGSGLFGFLILLLLMPLAVGCL